MKEIKLLEHLLGNLKAGRPAGFGLLLGSSKSTAKNISDMGLFEGYTIAPRTHDVNGFAVPAPEVEGLDKGQEYFFPCVDNKEWFGWYFWSNDKCDTLLLERRSVFLTQEAAIANAKAMLGIDPYSEGEE